MSKQYFYNRYNPISCHPALAATYGLNFDLATFTGYVMSNKVLAMALGEIQSKAGMTIASLRLTLLAIGTSGRDFMTTAAQATLAKKAGVCKATLQKAIVLLAKAGVIRTSHRNKVVNGKNKRISSHTVLSGFISFARWLAKVSIKRNVGSVNVTATGDYYSVHADGEILAFDTSTGEIFPANYDQFEHRSASQVGDSL